MYIVLQSEPIIVPFYILFSGAADLDPFMYIVLQSELYPSKYCLRGRRFRPFMYIVQSKSIIIPMSFYVLFE